MRSEETATTYRDELDEIAMSEAVERATDEAERKARSEPVRLMFKAAPGVHFVKIKPNSKAPIGAQWQRRPLTEAAAVEWVERGERLGIIPLSAGAGVLDLDSGGEESLRLAVEAIGEPVAKVETGSSTPDKPRYHLIYPAGGACGFGAWAGGEMRVESGQCVIYSLKAWAEAIGLINHRALPPVDFSKIADAKTAKRARRSPTRSKRARSVMSPLEVPSEPVAGLRERTLSLLGSEARRAKNRSDASVRMHRVREWYVACRHVQVKAGWWKGQNVKKQIESDLDKWIEAFVVYFEDAQRERIEDEAIAAAIVDRHSPKAATVSVPEGSESPTIGPEGGDAEGIELTAHKTNTPGAAKESIDRLGYRLRLNIYGPVAEVSRRGGEWQPLEDGADASMWSEAADRCYWQWTTGKEPPVEHIKHAVFSSDIRTMTMRAALHRNAFDPVRDWLDSLPKWTPAMPSRLFTLMSDAGMIVGAKRRITLHSTGEETTVDLEGWAQSYLPVEIVRLTYHPGAMRMPLPVLFGVRGGEGKSTLGEHILPPHLQVYHSSDYRFAMDEQKTANYFLGHKVLELREFGVSRRDDWGIVKGITAAPRVVARLPYDKAQTRVRRHDAWYVSTNKANLPEDDPALHRRFPYIRIGGRVKRVNGVAWRDHLAEPLEGGFTRREWLFAEAKWLVLSQPSTAAEFSLFPNHLDPEDLLAFNRLQGGTFATAGTEMLSSIAAGIECLIEHLTDRDEDTATLDDLRSGMLCADVGAKWRPLEDCERDSLTLEDVGRVRAVPKHTLLNGVQAFANAAAGRSAFFEWRQTSRRSSRVRRLFLCR